MVFTYSMTGKRISCKIILPDFEFVDYYIMKRNMTSVSGWISHVSELCCAGMLFFVDTELHH